MKLINLFCVYIWHLWKWGDEWSETSTNEKELLAEKWLSIWQATEGGRNIPTSVSFASSPQSLLEVTSPLTILDPSRKAFCLQVPFYPLKRKQFSSPRIWNDWLEINVCSFLVRPNRFYSLVTKWIYTSIYLYYVHYLYVKN